MITEWFLGLVATVVGWIADLFGEWTPPPELISATEGAGSLLGEFSAVGVWVDWPFLTACVVAQLTTWGIVLGIKLVRAVAAHFPGFGGSGD